MLKVWQYALLCIVVCIAARLVFQTLLPLLPLVFVGAVVMTVFSAIYHKKRKW